MTAHLEAARDLVVIVAFLGMVLVWAVILGAA